MILTFLYKTEIAKKSIQHTIYSVDIESTLEKWVSRIEDLQTHEYSFDKDQVKNIKQQFLEGKINKQFDKEPYCIKYKVADSFQLVNIDRINSGEPDFVAKVTYLTTDEGGKLRHVISGYRPHIKFDGRKEFTSGEQLFIDKEKVYPGDTAIAEIRIAGNDFFKNYLFVGLHFEIAEASHLVGHGAIIEIINKSLQQTSC
jgi:hypothetical protein